MLHVQPLRRRLKRIAFSSERTLLNRVTRQFADFWSSLRLRIELPLPVLLAQRRKRGTSQSRQRAPSSARRRANSSSANQDPFLTIGDVRLDLKLISHQLKNDLRD